MWCWIIGVSTEEQMRSKMRSTIKILAMAFWVKGKEKGLIVQRYPDVYEYE